MANSYVCQTLSSAGNSWEFAPRAWVHLDTMCVRVWVYLDTECLRVWVCVDNHTCQSVRIAECGYA